MPIRLERIKNKIVDTLAEPERINEKSKFWMMSKLERKQFLIDATESLGIDIDGETLDRIMSRNRDIRALNKELLGAAKFGLNLTKEEQEGKRRLVMKSLSKELLVMRRKVSSEKRLLKYWQ